MILNIMQPIVDTLFRGMIAHVLAIRLLIDGIKRRNIESIITFVTID